MKDGMEEVRQARKTKLELEEMRKRQGTNSQTNNRSEQKDEI
jgi:hypothetical protein